MNIPEINENVDLLPYTTFGLHAKAERFASYSSLKELKYLARNIDFMNDRILHIGGGSNLLFASDFKGLVLHSQIRGINIYRKNEDTVFAIAGAGENWSDFVDYCVDEELGGLENLALIPGEVGASAIQNIGAYGVEAGDRIHAVECYDTLTGEVTTFKAGECKFGYRDSIFKKEYKGRYIVLRVSFRLSPSTEAQHLDYGPLKSLGERLGHRPSISEVRDEVKQIRKEKLPDPKETGSAGSFFKNPVISREYYEKVVLEHNPDVPHYDLPGDMVKIPAGWLIEHAGLKGHRIGGAEVYTKQSLVIVNSGSATAGDVIELSKFVRDQVRNKFAITLRPEVNIIDTRIHVRFLGTGTSKGVPEIACNCDVCKSEDSRDKRLRSSILVNTMGLDILIDTTPDFRAQALTADITNLDAVLFTHKHYDHVDGIDDLRVFTATTPMPVYMQHEVIDSLRKRVDYCFKPQTYPGVASFDVHEIDENRPFMIEGLKIVPIPVMHGQMHIVGYRIGNFAYITDASSIPAKSMEKLMGLDVLVINALRIQPHFAHFSLDQALDIIGRLNPRKAYLTHISHQLGRYADITPTLPSNVEIATDGLEIYCQ